MTHRPRLVASPPLRRLALGGALCAALLAPALPASGAATARPPVGEAVCLEPTAGPRLLPLPAPGGFRRHVTHPYFPLRPGNRWVYRGFGADAGSPT